MTIRYEDFLAVLPGAEDKGKYIVGRCPFHHDASPSLLVYRDGWFHCLAAGCGRSGRWQLLWDKLKGRPISIRTENRVHYHTPASLNGFESREQQAYQAHLFLERWPSFQWYLEMRGLVDAIEIHELGYQAGWYTIPVWDADGVFQTVVFRAAPHVQEATGYRYWCGHKPVPYIPDHRLVQQSEYLVVVYGMLDALTLDKLRLPVVTSTAGADTFKAEWLDEYRRPIYVVPDAGEEKTALRLAQALGIRGRVIYLDYPKGLKDTNDFLRTGKEKELLAQLGRKIR